VIPHHVLESGGSLVIQGILKVMVPRFVKVREMGRRRKRGKKGREGASACREVRGRDPL
jgi:hypothetical protein